MSHIRIGLACGLALVACKKTPKVAPPPSIEVLQNDCDDGKAERCRALGDEYKTGSRVKRDPTKAARSYGKSCTASHQPGCYALAMAIAEGRGAKQDLQRVEELLDQACAADVADACLVRGTRLRDGVSNPDALVQKALQINLRNCEADDAQACRRAAGQLNAGGFGVTPNKKRYEALLAKACKLGNADGCRAAGGYLGDDSSWNRKASELLRARCKAGHHRDCITLAELVDEGEAEKLLEDTCAAGDPLGCMNLALRVRKARPNQASSIVDDLCKPGGDLTTCVICTADALCAPAPPAEVARKRFEAGCAAGEGLACHELAELAPAEAAAELHDKACSRGSSESCAMLWRSAHGEDKRRYRALACLLGHEGACEPRGIVN